MEIRSFLAFELPRGIMTTLVRVAGQLRKTPLDMRWVKEENIHLTMVFIGNIGIEHVDPIKGKLQEVCRDYGSFFLALEGIGCFPNNRRPRVLWLGLRGDLERLGTFRDALQEPLKDYGVKPEQRPFKPHLTLGRFRSNPGNEILLRDLLLEYRDTESPECRLDRLTFFRSDLKTGGAVYSKLAAWSLEGTK